MYMYMYSNLCFVPVPLWDGIGVPSAQQGKSACTVTIGYMYIYIGFGPCVNLRPEKCALWQVSN